MKNKFGTIKNIILLIASALTLVAVSFAWLSLSRRNVVSSVDTDVNGSTLAVKYYESTDGGSNYSLLSGNLEMNNMSEGSKRFYKMDVTTYSTPIKLIMSFDNLSSSNTLAKSVYFDYKLVCNDNNQVLANRTGLKMSDYASTSVFSQDLSTMQGNGRRNYSIYYDVYLLSGSSPVSGSGSLGEVKIIGQQVG